MNRKFNDSIFDTLLEDTSSGGYHIFLKKEYLKEFSIQMYVYNLTKPLPTDKKLLKVYHDCKNWFPFVGSALIKFRDNKPTILYQISLNNAFKVPIKLRNVTFSIYPE